MDMFNSMDIVSIYTIVYIYILFETKQATSSIRLVDFKGLRRVR